MFARCWNDNNPSPKFLTASRAVASSSSCSILGSDRTAITALTGRTSFINSICLAASDVFIIVSPVILPPGRLKLFTSPCCTGSPGVMNTIGMVFVAAMAARAAGAPLTAAITATFALTRPAAREGNSSGWLRAHAYSMSTLRALPWPMSKRTPRSRGFFYLALRIDWGIGERPEGVGQHISRAQPLKYLFIARRRIVDMCHQRHADLVGNLYRDVERHSTGAAGRAGADTHLDPDDNVAIVIRHLNRIERRQQTNFFAFSDHYALRKGVDACERHMQI